jgi:glycosyltransferase involved in cell wall biosynthesis
LADAIVVNSRWTADSIISQGAERSKVVILPLAYEAPIAGLGGERDGSSRRLRVLWLGTVCLRKGIPYLLEAAKELVSEPVDFFVAGPFSINKQHLRTASSNVRWLGSVPRPDAARLFAAADVFVLPTISDGFGITQLEAMAWGLPVIATQNCGDVVEHGVSGFRVPPRDSGALVDAIMKFVVDPGLASAMSDACRRRVRDFSVKRYAAGLEGLMLERMKVANGCRA